MTSNLPMTQYMNRFAYSHNWFEQDFQQIGRNVTILFDGTPCTIIYKIYNREGDLFENQTTHLTVEEVNAMISGYLTVEAWKNHDQTQRTYDIPSFDIRPDRAPYNEPENN